MVVTGVKRSRTTGVIARGGDASRLAQLEEFAAACSEIDFQPPLSQKERNFLQELQTERITWQ